jgi:beta-barrel assembly-enhancing protease
MRRAAFYLVILISMPVFVYSCESGINIFSQQDEVELGNQVDAEIRSNPQEYPIYTGNPSVKNYINQRIFNHILESPRIQSKNVYSYRMEIIAKDDILNAFALPGGSIYVYTGLLKYLDSEAALAGVVGHEIAHAERRHATQRLTAYYGVSFLLSLLLGDSPSQIAEIAANLFVGVAFLANSRSDENESDEYSYQYLKDSRYYAGGVKFFFEKLRDDGLVSSEPDKIGTFLSTHPDPIARISETNTRLQSDNIPVLTWQASGEGIYRDEYNTNIKSKLN